MDSVSEITLGRFLLVYLLLLIILGIMRKYKISQSKLVIISSLQMTIQLVLAGFILTYIFKNPKPIYTVIYIILMMLFAIHRVLSKNKDLNFKFKFYVVMSLVLSCLGVIIFFIITIVNQNIFNPQYTIPISGMVFGNVMTGLNLGLKTFYENLYINKDRIETLLNFGSEPSSILRPIVFQSLETALLPTLNSMVGMGIVSLPGMMTGQILSGTLPNTAILYQISIMIIITSVVCLSVFLSLYLGHKTLYNKDSQFIF